MDPVRVEEDALGQRGLARIDVGADADIANFGEVECHLGKVPVEGVPSFEQTARVSGARSAGSIHEAGTRRQQRG